MILGNLNGILNGILQWKTHLITTRARCNSGLRVALQSCETVSPHDGVIHLDRCSLIVPRIDFHKRQRDRHLDVRAGR